VFGHHAALLATMKGLPLAYNKDMQEDKEAVFDTVDTLLSCLRVGSIVLENLTVNEERARSAASRGFLNATELADYMVKKGIPFRTAHDTVGKAVLFASENGRELDELTLEEFRRFSESIGEDVFAALSLESAVDSKSQTGGTSRSRVAEALDGARQSLNDS
jgi:argininosuccinate lyase